MLNVYYPDRPEHVRPYSHDVKQMYSPPAKDQFSLQKRAELCFHSKIEAGLWTEAKDLDMLLQQEHRKKTRLFLFLLLFIFVCFVPHLPPEPRSCAAPPQTASPLQASQPIRARADCRPAARQRWGMQLRTMVSVVPMVLNPCYSTSPQNHLGLTQGSEESHGGQC